MNSFLIFYLFIVIVDMNQMFGQIFNSKISLKLYNLHMTIPHFLLCEPFLLLFPFVPLYYSADYIEEPSKKQFDSDRGFQSGISSYKLDCNSRFWITAWIPCLELKHCTTNILKDNLLTHLCSSPSLFGYKIPTLLNRQL